MQITDTHIHTWNFERAEYAWLNNDLSILNRSYFIEELEEERLAAGITQGILVQAANNFGDTDWMLEVAAKTNWVDGVVGWLPLMQPNKVMQALNEKYAANKYFKGVRHLIHDEANDRWLLQDEVVESLHILSTFKLTYDFVGVHPAHIETALQVANKVPSLPMVFDHLNQPPIALGEKFGRWGELMKEASKHKPLYMKISGLGTTAKKADWCADDIKPYVEFALEHFGVDRCFCGGDYPVSLLAGSYVKIWQVYKDVLQDLLRDDELEKVFHKNAVNFYGLV